ncbi:hypothetical protein EAG_04874 [Camponotus floridanus]|uniref:Uncharacterized protein n=1 Tax=Camponotus floridanus TaxID=104421 RepID=E2ASK3_CAMFO|nr:hypothetical protein EAG_04874 [Camponotus floridanus]
MFAPVLEVSASVSDKTCGECAQVEPRGFCTQKKKDILVLKRTAIERDEVDYEDGGTDENNSGELEESDTSSKLNDMYTEGGVMRPLRHKTDASGTLYDEVYDDNDLNAYLLRRELAGFKRRERLDVKKPGPLFSTNNYAFKTQSPPNEYNLIIISHQTMLSLALLLFIYSKRIVLNVCRHNRQNVIDRMNRAMHLSGISSSVYQNSMLSNCSLMAVFANLIALSGDLRDVEFAKRRSWLNAENLDSELPSLCAIIALPSEARRQLNPEKYFLLCTQASATNYATDYWGHGFYDPFGRKRFTAELHQMRRHQSLPCLFGLAHSIRPRNNSDSFYDLSQQESLKWIMYLSRIEGIATLIRKSCRSKRIDLWISLRVEPHTTFVRLTRHIETHKFRIEPKCNLFVRDILKRFARHELDCGQLGFSKVFGERSRYHAVLFRPPFRCRSNLERGAVRRSRSRDTIPFTAKATIEMYTTTGFLLQTERCKGCPMTEGPYFKDVLLMSFRVKKVQ